MLERDTNLVESLGHELQRRRVVIVAGAGVSAAAAGLPDWRDLIDSAIAHLRTVGTADEEQINDIQAQLQQASTPGDLIVCADTVKALLG